jgi:hypothetical protein
MLHGRRSSVGIAARTNPLVQFAGLRGGTGRRACCCSSHCSRLALQLDDVSGRRKHAGYRAPLLARFLPLMVIEGATALGEASRMDLLYLGLTVGFFVVSWAFVVACDRLS